jgi:hypothetical protein
MLEGYYIDEYRPVIFSVIFCVYINNLRMAGEPKTSEEYIEKVLSDAEAQKNEWIMSHSEQHREYLDKKDHYGACLTFFILLLGIVFFSYIGVKIISYFGPEVNSEEA